ncbi:MAG TPA: sigma-70 family RNA polymerase sigma factor [Candidatus Acidoferrales bacterium]|nr:sigma-70 family RNA polymerase sigma factor [Candidatus Acidoferrales bacterium]
MATATFARKMNEAAGSIAYLAQVDVPENVAQLLANGEEAALVAAAQAGDASAFETLVNRYERRIYRLAWNITQNEEDAEDVSQDAFLKAFQHLANFRGHSRFYTWLVRITVNQALMKLRKRRRREVSLDDPVEAEESLMPREIEDWGPSPEERFGQEQLGRFLAAAIAELNIGLRVVFQLRDVEELSIEQTAELLGISKAAVKSRLLRARLKLREMLQVHFRPSAEGEIRSWAVGASCA